MPNLPRPPDLNSVENVWVAISKYKQEGHTHNRVAVVNNALQAWEYLRCEEGHVKLVAFMPRRLNCGLVAGCANAKY